MRRKLLFKRKQAYVGLLVVNLIFRFFWMLTLLPEDRPTIFGRDVQVRDGGVAPLTVRSKPSNLDD